jgi:predicted nucleotide-binding protein
LVRTSEVRVVDARSSERSETPDLSADERQILERVYERLSKQGRWPTYQEVDFDADQHGVDGPLATLRTLDPEYVHGVGAAGLPSKTQELSLSLLGLAAVATWNGQAKSDLELFFESVRVAVHISDTTVPPSVARFNALEFLSTIYPSGPHEPTVIRLGWIWRAAGPQLWEQLNGVGSVVWGANLNQQALRAYRRIPNLSTFLVIERQRLSGNAAPTASGMEPSAVVGIRPAETASTSDAALEPTGNPRGARKDARAVFVIHGRNEALRKSMFDYLRALDLSPIEWSMAVEWTGHGSPYIGDVLDTAFDRAQAVVVLLTPDEVAYLQPRYAHGESDPETEPAPQARPNVLFEAGMALGRDPARTVVVEVGEVRPFSDIAGRHTIRLSNAAPARLSLARRLETAGCTANTTGTDWLSAGDFAAPAAPGDGLPLGRRVPSSAIPRPPVDFHLKYHPKGGKSLGGNLQVINRGTETAYEVTVTIPEEAALRLREKDETVTKIPGNGRHVTLSTLNKGPGRLAGGFGEVRFDVAVTGRTESGETVTQEIFLDING